MKIGMNTLMVMLAFIVLGSIIGSAVFLQTPERDMRDFAQCITNAGATMYGTYWCSNCLNQKEDFGSAFEIINYIECSSPESHTFDLCDGIEGVPVWSNNQNEALMGRQTMESLAEFYSCDLPEDYE